MKKTYSLYEAKAKLSAIVRQVREESSVTVTVRVLARRTGALQRFLDERE